MRGAIDAHEAVTAIRCDSHEPVFRPENVAPQTVASPTGCL
jgi:hypothetical protein